jgi:outer membrane protein assembly factor BamB
MIKRIVFLLLAAFLLSVSLYTDSKAVAEIARLSQQSEYTLAPDDLPAGCQPGYLIIAPFDMVDGDTFHDFRAFKRGLGFEVNIVAVESILSTSPGVDDPEKIRNYLQTVYPLRSVLPRNIRYVLLVGDLDDIPMREIHPFWPENDVTPSDWYYADLTGDWDSNGDGMYGQGVLTDGPTDLADLHYEVAVGRIPFSSGQSVRVTLNRIMDFERDSRDWKLNTILAGGFMEFTGRAWNPIDDPAGGYEIHGYRIGSDTDSAVVMEAIWTGALNNNGMNRTRLYETAPNILGNPQSAFVSDFDLSADQLVDVWNMEAHGLVNLKGHASPFRISQYQWTAEIDPDGVINNPTSPAFTGFSEYEIEGTAMFEADDIFRLNPMSSPLLHPSVVVASGCSTAGLELNDGMVARFLISQKAAAYIGTLGPVQYWPGWSQPTNRGWSQDILLRLNQSILSAGTLLGDAVYGSLESLFDATLISPRGRGLVNHALFGDPAMSYWGGGAEFDSPWPMFRHDIQNSGRTSYDGPAIPVVRWTFPLNPGPFSNGVPSPIVGPDGTIYAGNQAGVLYAINPDGSEKWHYQAGGAINSGPILTVGGVLYFRAEDGYLYALTTANELRWRVPVEMNPGTAGPTPGQPPFSNSPRVMPDGTVLALSTVFDFGTTVGIFNKYHPTGNLVSSAAHLEAFGASGTPAVSRDGHIYYSLWDGTLNTGFDLEAPSLGSPAVGNNGSIYVGTSEGDLISINSAMDENWRYSIGEPDINSSPALDEDQNVYYGSVNHNVYSLDHEGNFRWLFDTGGAVDSSPALDDSRVYVVGGPSSSARLYALNQADGSLAWSVPIGGSPNFGSSPAIGFSHMVFVVSQTGLLYAIGPEGPLPPSSTQAVAVSPLEIDITWRDNSSDEISFQLERRSGWYGTYQTIATLPSNQTSYEDKSVLSNHAYFYRLKALGSASSDYSNQTQARTPPLAPVAPAGLSAAAKSAYEIRLQWNPMSAVAQGIEIYRSNTAAGPFTWIGWAPNGVTTYLDQHPDLIEGNTIKSGTPSPGQTYFYKIRAYNETGFSASTTPVSATTLDLNLAPPRSFHAEVHGYSYTTLTWQLPATNDINAISGYILERASKYLPFFQQIASLSASTLSYTDLVQDGGDTIYRLRAYNSTDQSPFVLSNTVFILKNAFHLYLPVMNR